jgi:hypothetical protein
VELGLEPPDDGSGVGGSYDAALARANPRTGGRGRGGRGSGSLLDRLRQASAR